MAIPSKNLDVPYRDPVVERTGLLTNSWVGFFRSLYEIVYALGAEKSVQLENNQSVAADIEGLKVSARATSYAVVEYLIQRVTTSTGATELLEAGSFALIYRPTDDDWDLVVQHEEVPDDAGVDFTVTDAGQVQYTSSNITGTASISRIVYRMRTLAGKSSLYSSPGARA